MSKITQQTRDAAYQAVLPLAQNREERAFEALRGRLAGLTAGEVAEATGLPLNGARSALTYLLEGRRVVVLGKRDCTAPNTSKTVKAAVLREELKRRHLTPTRDHLTRVGKKKSQVAVTAVARELAGFVWAIARQVKPQAAVA